MWEYIGIMKYWIIAVIALFVGVFYFIHQSNKADADRLLKQQEEYHQKIKAEASAEKEKLLAKEKKIQTDKSVIELQAKYLMDYVDAKMVIESTKMGDVDKKFYADLGSRWADAFRVAGSTARINLSQPVKDLQSIKRDLEAKQTSTFCEAKLKGELVKSYDYAIDGFLQFMTKNEAISDVFLEISTKYQKNASALIDYC